MRCPRIDALNTTNDTVFPPCRVVEECIAQCMDHLQRESPAGDPNNFDFVTHDAHDLSLSLDESSLFSLRVSTNNAEQGAYLPRVPRKPN